MNTLLRRLPLATGLLLPALALAHEGHGLGGTHWHASDVLGFVVGAAVAGLILWQLRK